MGGASWGALVDSAEADLNQEPVQLQYFVLFTMVKLS